MRTPFGLRYTTTLPTLKFGNIYHLNLNSLFPVTVQLHPTTDSLDVDREQITYMLSRASLQSAGVEQLGNRRLVPQRACSDDNAHNN